MKSFFKILLIAFLILGLLTVGIAVIFYNSPALQQRVAIRAIENATDLEAEMYYFHSTFSGTEIRGLKLKAEEEYIEMESLKMEYTFGGLSSDPAVLKSVSVKGLLVDISASGGLQLLQATEAEGDPDEREAPTGEPPSLEDARLPVAIGALEFDGEIRLPENQVLVLDIRMKDLIPGSTGTFALDLDSPGSGGEALFRNASVSFQGEVSQSAEGKLQKLKADGSVTLTGLRPPDYEGPPLGLKVGPGFSLEAVPDSIEFALPFMVSGPSTRTEGRLSGNAAMKEFTLQRFDIILEADQLDLDEWQPVLGILPSSEEPAETDRTPDTRPPWDGYVGTLQAKLGRFKFGENEFRDLSATIELPENGPVTVSTSAQNDESPLQAQLEMAFDQENAESPYQLTGTATINKLDVTPFLRTSPDDPNPMLEGTFDLEANFQSTSPNLELIAEKLSGEARLNSAGDGTFRPLGEKTTMASGVSGLLGALSGSVKELGWVSQVINQLKEIPYSEMTFSVARESDLDLILREMDLISRETRIRGEGEIQYRAGVDFLRLPMDLKFQLFAKGRLAEALKAGGQLQSQEPDPLGFLPGPPLPIKGSIAEPESLLQNMLMESAPQLLPGLLGN